MGFVRKRLISMPISDTITSAERLLMPGMVVSISIATRKGSTFAVACRQYSLESLDHCSAARLFAFIMGALADAVAGARRTDRESPSASFAGGSVLSASLSRSRAMARIHSGRAEKPVRRSSRIAGPW